MTSAVIVSLRVAATPMQAFEAFTSDISQWWQPDTLFKLTPRGDGTLRFEPGVGGRLITTLDNGKEFEIGRVSVWQPGEKLSLTWRTASFRPDQTTELTVLFEAVRHQTRITIEHRGWNTIPQEHAARHGFNLMLFQRQLAAHWRSQLVSLVEIACEQQCRS